MTGEIGETYLSELHNRTREKNQTGFEDFLENTQKGKTTYIAVVTDPTGGIVDLSDEFAPELGMPKEHLNNFRALRSSLDINDDVSRHNTAVSKTELEEKYIDYIEEDDKAKEKIRELVRRVKNGERINLVCFEKKPKWCHRHLLTKKIEEKL